MDEWKLIEKTKPIENKINNALSYLPSLREAREKHIQTSTRNSNANEICWEEMTREFVGHLGNIFKEDFFA
ncbi:MAG: hypothetical protein PHF35_00690 [Candidatus Moranbacteria bacterium]|nr:hypothetical protein [Candidatus Moranbacteria bacterium]